MKTIELTDGSFALVDDEDFDRLNKFSWYPIKGNSGNAAARNQVVAGEDTAVRMHRELLNLALNDPRQVDHIDFNCLNNQKANLRLASRAENCQHRGKANKKCTSKYKGVCFRKDSQQWRAYITWNKKRENLGQYEIEEEAAKAYNVAALKYHKEYAVLNSIPIIV